MATTPLLTAQVIYPLAWPSGAFLGVLGALAVKCLAPWFSLCRAIPNASAQRQLESIAVAALTGAQGERRVTRSVSRNIRTSA